MTAAVRRARRVRPRGPGRAAASAGRSRISSSAAVPGSTKAGWGRSTRASGTWRAAASRKRLFEAECLREYAETFPTVCGDFAFYQFPTEEFWRNLFRRTPASFPLRLQSAGTDHLQSVPVASRATERRPARDNEAFLDARLLKEMFLRPLWPYRDKTALLIFEFGAFGRRSFAELHEFLDRLDPFLAALPRGVPLRGGDPQPGVSGEGLLRVPARARRGARLQRVVEDAGIAEPDGDSRFGDRGLPGLPGAAAARACVRGRGGELPAVHKGAGPESGGAGIDAAADRAGAREQSSGCSCSSTTGWRGMRR